MPFGFLLIQSVIFRIFQAPKASLVQAAPGGETSDSATVGGQAATANVPTGRVRVSGVGEFLVVSFKELSFFGLIFFEEKKGSNSYNFFIILKFAEFFWEELRKQHRGDGEKVGLEDTSEGFD